MVLLQIDIPLYGSVCEQGLIATPNLHRGLQIFHLLYFMYLECVFMFQSRPPFRLFSYFCHSNISYTNWKKHRWCAWDSNPWPQEGKRRQNHRAMAVAPLRMSLNQIAHFSKEELCQTKQCLRRLLRITVREQHWIVLVAGLNRNR